MRSISLLFAVLSAAPALAHPGHVETAGGHSHWFEVAVGLLLVVPIAAWLASRLLKRPVADNG